jgi:excisionase family DNA binding protein
MSMLLTIPQAAASLAISERQVYRLIGNGRLAVVNLGARCYRIRPEDLDALVRRNLTTHTPAECLSTGVPRKSAGASKSRTTGSGLESLLRPSPARPRRIK